MEIFRSKKNKIIIDNCLHYLIISLLIFIVFPFKLSSFIDIGFLSNRTIAFFIMIISIITYSIKIIILQNLNIDIISKLVVCIFISSFFINLFFHNNQIATYFTIFNDIAIKSQDYQLYFAKYGYSILTYFVICNEVYSNKKLKKNIVNIFIILGIIVSILFFMVQFNIQGYGVESSLLNDFGEVDAKYGRFTFMSWNENEISIFFTFCYSFVVSRLIDNKHNNLILQFGNIIAMIFLLNSIILTGTRTGLIIVALIIFTMIFIFIKRRFDAKYLLIAFLISSLIVVLKFKFQDNPLKERMIINENFLTLGGRLENWLFTINEAKNNLFFGSGLLEYFKREDSLPENLYLELISFSGIIPLLLLFMILIICLHKSIKLLKLNNSENIILLIPLFSTTNVLNILSLKIFWIVFGIFVANIRLLMKKDKINTLIQQDINN